MTIFYL